jgi:Fic family protein
MMILYERPTNWIRYELHSVLPELAGAKAALMSLTSMPYQRSWAEKLQAVQLKREVAGTSRIEGADFTERELDAALQESPEQLFTRSQRQAASAVATYRWLTQLPNDRPIDMGLICEIHHRMVTGADDDHCPPGKVRTQDQNVNFGIPRHRGVNGGKECEEALQALCQASQTTYYGHDSLIQALALHYHFASMHPFLDGNGRTARALEALMLQRIGLRDSLFIAMSNYYYEEKNAYLEALSEVRSLSHDLTPFLRLGLKGIELQCRRLFLEIRTHLAKALYRNMAFDFFNRLKTPKRRAMTGRQLEILKLLLENEVMLLPELTERTRHVYQVKNPFVALIRDLNDLINLQAIGYDKLPDNQFRMKINLEWPTQITETEFFKKIKALPKAKTLSFLS